MRLKKLVFADLLIKGQKSIVMIMKSIKEGITLVQPKKHDELHRRRVIYIDINGRELNTFTDLKNSPLSVTQIMHGKLLKVILEREATVARAHEVEILFAIIQPS